MTDSKPARTLLDIPLQCPSTIAQVNVESDWLAAVGIEAGERVIVLRKAPFGGPLHIRTETGGEFAIGRPLGDSILMED
jgi:ferrous iron transport protein A